MKGGIPWNSPIYPRCCGERKFYCPTTYRACGLNSCCPDDYPIHCSEGGYCCPSSYPICGGNKQCYDMQGCHCQGCNPNPCQFMKCSECEACCAMYEGICRREFSCTIREPGKYLGYRSVLANLTCPGK